MKLCRELSDLVVYTNSVAAHDVVEDGMRGAPMVTLQPYQENTMHWFPNLC